MPILPMNSTSSQETNKSLFLRLIDEGFNKGNLTIVDELVSQDSKEHQRGTMTGLKARKK
jgi:hypothetical protein